MRTERQSLPRERHWICARRLRERRVTLGLTQLEVAQALRRQGLDLGNRALSAMEHGHALDVGWLPELATVLDCTTTYLLGMTEDPHGWQPAPTPMPAPPAPLIAAAAATDVAAADTVATDTVADIPVPQSPTSDELGAEHCGWILGPNVPDRNPAGG